MKYKHRFDPLAVNEYEKAYLWYFKRSILAAENFVKEIDQCISLICTDPYRYRNPYKKFREISLKKYPFYIIYFIDDAIKTVIITSVYHHKRRPGRKYKK